MIKESTRKTYSAVWDMYENCLKVYYPNDKCDLPLKHDTILEYISHLKYNGYSPATIATHVSALAYPHKLNGLLDPAGHPMVTKVIKALVKGTVADGRKPISWNQLERMCSVLRGQLHSEYDYYMYKALFILMFLACLRIGEVCVGKGNKNTLQYEDMEVNWSTY